MNDLHINVCAYLRVPKALNRACYDLTKNLVVVTSQGNDIILISNLIPSITEDSDVTMIDEYYIRSAIEKFRNTHCEHIDLFSVLADKRLSVEFGFLTYWA
jgi:EAL domain-containing protein (putative c-di-GMP-specific phosphodiesterase class I)